MDLDSLIGWRLIFLVCEYNFAAVLRFPVLLFSCISELSCDEAYCRWDTWCFSPERWCQPKYRLHPHLHHSDGYFLLKSAHNPQPQYDGGSEPDPKMHTGDKVQTPVDHKNTGSKCFQPTAQPHSHPKDREYILTQLWPLNFFSNNFQAVSICN